MQIMAEVEKPICSSAMLCLTSVQVYSYPSGFAEGKMYQSNASNTSVVSGSSWYMYINCKIITKPKDNSIAINILETHTYYMAFSKVKVIIQHLEIYVSAL